MGTPQLGALAVGTAAFTASFWLFSFLAYGVTPRVARAFGTGDDAAAARTGVQALLLAVSIGAVLTMLGLLFAEHVVRMLGASGDVARFAEPYLRIRILAAAAVLIVQVGNGWLRGAQDTRTAFVITAGGAVVNVVLDYILIYPVGWGVEGAAWATVIGQALSAALFVAIMLRRMRGPRWRWDRGEARALGRVGLDLSVRTGSLLAALTIATSVAARMGQVPLASWQIAMQVFLLLALTLDSVAIAAQALIALRLGAGEPEPVTAVGRRLMSWGTGLGLGLSVVLLVLSRPVTSIFSADPEVVSATAALLVWLAIVQPLAAIAFTLDGILIGASDTRFLAVAMAASSAVYVGLAVVALQQDWGIAGLAVGMTVWLFTRVATTGIRWQREKWVTV